MALPDTERPSEPATPPAPEETDGRHPGRLLSDAELQGFVGRSSGPPITAPDPVNQAMIRHWVEAMGDENPVYVDQAAAAAAGFPGVIAPPAMLQAWIMRGYRASVAVEEARAAGLPPPTPSPLDELNARLDAAGYTSIVATNCEQRYRRPLVLGDRLSCQSVIESVSTRKQTALGEGYFVTTLLRFTDAAGAEVATMTFRVLKFAPRQREAGPGSPSPARPKRPRPAVTADIAFFFEHARQGVLAVQRCDGCGQLRHPPTPSCPHCQSLDWQPSPVAGTGTLFSYVVVHHPQVPAFDYPLPIGLVELDEGVRMVGQLVGVDPAELGIGMPVVAELTAVDDELTLPFFRPRGARP